MKFPRLRWLLVTAAFIQVAAGVPAPGVAQDSGDGTGGELCDVGEGVQFVDVADADYGADYILCARILGLSRGLGDGSFGPDQELDRGQMAAFLVRLWRDILGRACPAGDDPFTDVDDTHFAADDIACLYNLGITRGTSATTYGPAAGLEASQVTRFVTRLLNEITPGFCDTAAGELEASAGCLAAGGVVPSTSEAVSSRIASRAQMAVYLIGAWYTATNRGQPPTPPTRPVGPDTDPVEPQTPPTDPVEPQTPPTDPVEPQTPLTDPVDPDIHVFGEETVGDREWLAALEGTLTIPVFICGPVGQYTADDVRRATSQLNRGLDGFFNWLTSGRIDLVFSEGGLLLPGLDCTPGGQKASAVGLNLAIATWNLGPAGFAWYGGNAYVHSDFAFPFEESGLRIVVHELVHSVLRLPHFKGYSGGDVLIEEDILRRGGQENYRTSLTTPPLACYQYERLGWPVPEGFSEPCARLSPSAPVLWGIDTTDDGELEVRWLAPFFTDGVPVTGYTIETRHIDGNVFGRHEFPADTRTTTLKFPNSAGFEFQLWANSQYGQSEIAEVNTGWQNGSSISSNWDVRHNGKFGSVKVGPKPPLLEEVSVYDFTNNTVTLTWDAEEQIKHEEESGESLLYEFFIASDSAGEDTNTKCPPPLPLEQVFFIRCDATNGVWGNIYSIGSVNSSLGGWWTYVADNHDIFRVRGLEPSTQYTFRVRTCNSLTRYSCSRWSTVNASTLAVSTLPPPSGIRVVSGNDQVSGDWSLITWDPVPGAAAYQIEVVKGSTTYAFYRRPAHSFELPDDLLGSDFRIRSCVTLLYSHRCGDGEWTTVSVPRPAGQGTPPPYRVSVKEVSDAYTTLGYWTPRWPAGFAPYTLEYQYTDGTSDSGLQHHDGRFGYLELPTDPNKNYTIKMRNCEGTGTEGNNCSTWTTFAFSTYPAGSSVAPPSVRVTDVGDTRIDIAWKHVPGALSYDWEVETAPGIFIGETQPAYGGINLADDGVTPEYFPWLPPVEPGKEYTIRVRSCGAPTEPCGDWATTKVSTLP